MRFMNIDLHVSVIEDVATQFKALGYEVESYLMSGHAWALKKPRASLGDGPGADGKVGYGGVNLTTWESLFHDAPALNKVRAWQDEHQELAKFDGFVVTYPSSFALLYDRFPGKIVMDIPVRYDLQFTHDAEALRWYNERLGKLTDDGRLIAVANNKYDAAYYTYFTGRSCRHISSTCDYIDQHAGKYAAGPLVLAWGEHPGCREAHKQVREVLFVRDAIKSNYAHADIPKMAKAIVWIPYTTSIMSFFEHYWLGIPLFVPSKRFLLELANVGHALSQFSWYSKPLGGSLLPRVGTDLPDPHTPEGFKVWMDLYDFYDTEEFPHVTYFESWEHLRALVAEMREPQLKSISGLMLAHNEVRRNRNIIRWSDALGHVPAYGVLR